jgi:omega-6 fatty acid desaturase (delta-12 desaturase)
MRTEKELLIATKAFAAEDVWRSWRLLGITLGLYGLTLAACLAPLPLAWRVLFSGINGLLVVRLFILYHDFQHHTIFVGSSLAKLIMNTYGLLVLSPPSVWNRSHDHHHKHNAKDLMSSIGSFPTLSCEQYAHASAIERLKYRVARHPLTIGLGYLTIFMGGMCLRSLWIQPRLHKDSAMAILLHVILVVGLYIWGVDKLLLGLIVPLWVACGLGAYLFYAQHNFPGCKLNAKEDWTHASAALQSSSYLKTNALMQWFTGNIGYHHIHHLNAKIPFYRLPEAMAGIAELRKPASTSLHPRDIVACFRSNLWDPESQRLVSYSEARSARQRQVGLSESELQTSS